MKVIRKLGDLQTSQFKIVEVHHIRGSKLGVARIPKTLQTRRLNKLNLHGFAIAKHLHIETNSDGKNSLTQNYGLTRNFN